MAENVQAKSKGFSIDWLVKGTLTKIGDVFDRLTGRGWKPSSSLATSGLIERMKSLMDAEIREDQHGRRYVPHNVQLKMQWDKFSTDSEDSLRKLENEFLVAAVDHINDRHYYTYAPLAVSIKPDYFTSGVVLLVGFDKFDADEKEAAINVTVDGLSNSEPAREAVSEKKIISVRLKFEAGGKAVDKTLDLEEGRRVSVGRTKENGLQIDDQSISKAHASLLLNKQGVLVVADTGSTNGTFVGGERIAYGKAVEIKPETKLMFGLVNVSLTFQPLAASPSGTEDLPAKSEKYRVGDMEFSTRPASEGGPTPTFAGTSLSKTTAPAIAKPEVSELPETGEISDKYVTNTAPQPALSEAEIKVPIEEGER